MINELIKKLRKAADALEDLQSIQNTMEEMGIGKSLLVMRKWNQANPQQEEGRLVTKRAYTRKKPHWTQTPEGRIKMGIAIKKMWAAKRKKG